MNRLKKKAWKDFRSACAIAMAAMLLFGFAAYADIKGPKYLIIGLSYAGLCAGFFVFLNVRLRKRNNKPQYDEREFFLIQKSINIGNNVFIAYVFFALVIAYYLVGGRGMVPMWSIPPVLFCGTFLSGTIQSLFLIYHAKEGDE